MGERDRARSCCAAGLRSEICLVEIAVNSRLLASNTRFHILTPTAKIHVPLCSVSQDVLRFDHTLLAPAMASQLISQTHDSSAGAVIVIDPNDTVTLANVTVAQLAANPSAIQFF